MTALAVDLAIALFFVCALAGAALVEALLHVFTRCREPSCAKCWWARERAR